MIEKDKYSHRLSIDITEEQYFRLQKLIPWGMKRILFSVIVDDVIDILDGLSSNDEDKENAAASFIGLVVSKKIKLKDYSNVINERKVNSIPPKKV